MPPLSFPTTWPADLRLLTLACAACLDDRFLTSLRERLDGESPDWNKLEELSYYHRVAPLVFKSLKAVQHPGIPEDFLTRLGESCRHIALTNLHHGRELIRLLALFNRAGLEAVPFKGAYLAANTYGDLGLRESTDIDFFIHPEQLPAIIALLRQEGYTNPYRFTPAEEKRLYRTDCEYFLDYMVDGRRVFHVELHWQLGTQRHQLALNLDNMAAHLKADEINGFPVRALSPEMTLLTTAGHHGGKDYWNCLRQICDIAFLLKRYPTLNGPLLLKEARRHGLLRLCLHGIAMAHALFSVPAPEAIRPYLDQPRIQRLTDTYLHRLNPYRPGGDWTPRKHFFALWTYQMKARERWSDRAKICYFQIRQILAPNLRDTQSDKLPPKLHFLYYLAKPFRLIAEHLWKKS